MINKRKLLGLMAEVGVTQRELAKYLHKNENTIARKLSGKSPVDTEEAIMICDYLNITNNDVKVDIFLSRPSQK